MRGGGERRWDALRRGSRSLGAREAGMTRRSWGVWNEAREKKAVDGAVGVGVEWGAGEARPLGCAGGRCRRPRWGTTWHWAPHSERGRGVVGSWGSRGAVYSPRLAGSAACLSRLSSFPC